MGKKLFIGKLNYDTTEASLKEAFTAVAEVSSVKIIFDRESGRSKGFGFVEMEDGADAAIEALNGFELKGRALRVNEAQSKERSGGGGGGRRY